MKKLLIAAICLFCFGSLAAQKTRKQFNYASRLYESGKYDSARYIFQKIYYKGTGNQSLVAKAHYNVGAIYLETNQLALAKKVFKDILYSDFDDLDAGGLGSGLMGEPYALYKHNSASILATLSLDEKNFKEALEYTEMTDKQFPYVHFCGNEYAANAIYTACMYAKCYEGLNEIDNAIVKLLPVCFDSRFANNDSAVTMAIRLIKTKYTPEIIKEEVNVAYAGIDSQKVINSRYKYYRYFTTFLGATIFLFNQSEFNTTSNQLKEIDNYRYQFINSKFIKELLRKLNP